MPSSVSVWTVDATASIEIASGDVGEGPILLGVLGIERLSSGHLVVANEGSQNLLVYDSVGTFVEEIGSPGDGPGEFQGLQGFDTCSDDTVVAWSIGRVSFFASDGEFRRSIPRPRSSDGAVRELAGISSDCSTLLAVDWYPQQPDAEFWPHAIRWLPPDGEPITLREFVGRPMAPMTVAGRPTGMRVPFGATPRWVTDGAKVFLGLPVAPEVLAFHSPDSAATSIRWTVEPQPVIDADVELGEQRYREAIGEDSVVLPRWQEFPIPDRRPVFNELLIDDEGRLWVETYPTSAGGFPDVNPPRVGSGPGSWWVFDSAGELTGTIEIPSGLDPMLIAGGFVIGVFRDAFDVESVRFHRIIT